MKDKDLHILRFYSSFVLVSGGKVVGVTEPNMEYCPLAESLYRRFRPAKGGDEAARREIVKKAVESKIKEFGSFTAAREIERADIAIPYGASEIMMYGLRKKAIDAAVVVCEGAGTVITDRPEVVQGIGARMNGLFYTSPIAGIMKKLEKAGCHILSRKAGIDQAGGAEKAAGLGYKKIAVTVNASGTESLKVFRDIEKKTGSSITTLIVCTTGITAGRADEIKDHADLAWSCASNEVREIAGREAILQLSTKIPVFALTGKGLGLAAAYSSRPGLIKGLDRKKQFIVSGKSAGKKLMMGDFETRLAARRLPVRDRKEPRINAVHAETHEKGNSRKP